MACTGADISGRIFFAFFRLRVKKPELFSFVSKINGKICEIIDHSYCLLFGVLSVDDAGGNVFVKEFVDGGLIPFISVGIAAGGAAGWAENVAVGLADGLTFFLSIEKNKIQRIVNHHR